MERKGMGSIENAMRVLGDYGMDAEADRLSTLRNMRAALKPKNKEANHGSR
jgi:hypothetical protein